MSVNIIQDLDTEKLILLIKKVVLEDILKTDCDRNFYNICLSATKNSLSLWGIVATGYPCCIIGCRFKGDRHRNYVQHLMKSHPNLKNVICNFKKDCRRTFSNVDGLVNHLKKSHCSTRSEPLIPNISSTSSVVDIPCKCDLCSDKNFVSTT